SVRSDLELATWGFSRQYPRFLYPGSSERDPEKDAISGLSETLDGASPLSWQRTAGAIRKWAPDTVLIPAWTFAVAPALGWVARQLRSAGAAIVMVVHNAFDHEAAAWKDRLMMWQLGAADRFVTHNKALAKELSRRFPGTPVQVFPHPVFNDVPQATGALPRRADLELLFFGLVRPYKGLDVLVDAISQMPGDRIALTVAGEFWQGLEETQLQIAGLENPDCIELIPRYVSDAETAELFHRADALVLPYRSVTGSGVVSLALHYQRAVIASELPGFTELIRDGETGWLFPPGDATRLAKTIDGLDEVATKRAGEAAGALGKHLTWDRFARVALGEDVAAGVLA
ncbi:MAG: glycosyltransferase, partial [Pseudomonadota bacterium]